MSGLYEQWIHTLTCNSISFMHAWVARTFTVHGCISCVQSEEYALTMRTAGLRVRPLCGTRHQSLANGRRLQHGVHAALSLVVWQVWFNGSEIVLPYAHSDEKCCSGSTNGSVLTSWNDYFSIRLSMVARAYANDATLWILLALVAIINYQCEGNKFITIS